MRLWKALGVAGLAGVAATGAIIARNRRQRAQLTPEEIRARLHQRVSEAETARETDQHPDGPARSRPTSAWGQRASTESSARA
jgi:hypothetical protein